MRDFGIFSKVSDVCIFIEGFRSGADWDTYLSPREAIEHLEELGHPSDDANVTIYLEGNSDGVRGDRFRLNLQVKILDDMMRTLATIKSLAENAPETR